MKKRLFPLLFGAVMSLTLTSCFENPNKYKMEKTVFSYKYSDVMDNYYVKKSSIPSIGNPKILVLPVYFSNSNQFVPSDKLDLLCEDLNKAFFGTARDTGWHSVKSYYETESHGKCSLTGVVAEPYRITDSYASYAPESINTSMKTDQLINKAVNYYFSASGDSRSNYDLDGNGYLDGVVVIYIAPDYSGFEDQTNKGNLWAYTNWSQNEANKQSPALCNYVWASYDFIYSKLDSANRFGEEYAYGSGDTRFAKFDTHPYIHEMGHMFGLPDYYDYSSNRYTPAGGFSMQDYNVGGHDPFSTIALGWTEPYIPTESTTLEINTFQSSNEVILLTNKMNEDNSPFDEYFLLEYYSPSGLNGFDTANAYRGGYPVAPSESGIRLWHVDARLIYTNGLTFNANNITTKPDKGGYKVVEMMSNSYYSSKSTSYISRLGSSYADYNILQLIRNDELETYQPTSVLERYSLFKSGESFSMNKVKNQFKQTGKLNSGEDFEWTFSVTLRGETAKIDLIKLVEE